MNRRLTILAINVLAVVVLVGVFLMVPVPANAGGAEQISGTLVFDVAGECTDVEGDGSDFALILSGSLTGCHYVFVDDYTCSPSGTYREWGTEIFVGNYGDIEGTFSTTYLFTAKLENCDLAREIFGRCQHPIVAGTGTDDFSGVTGRIDVKDDVIVIGEQVDFYYRGHLRW